MSNLNITGTLNAGDLKLDNKSIQEIVERSIITRYGSGEMEMAGSETREIVPFTETISVGSKLTASSDGGVVIGKGVTKVLVSAQAGLYANNIAYLYADIYKNDTSVYRSMQQLRDSGYRAVPLSLPPALTDVVEGDVIYLKVASSTTNNVCTLANKRSYLTVEEVH